MYTFIDIYGNNKPERAKLIYNSVLIVRIIDSNYSLGDRYYSLCVSYIKSVKEVILWLLVLQKQLKVFKHLSRNQK